MRKKTIPSFLVLIALTNGGLHPAAAALTVTGRVTAEHTGALPAGTAVSLLRPTEEGDPVPITGARWTAQQDGNFRLSVDQPGIYVVRVQAPGLVPMEHSLEPLLEDLRLPEVELEQDLGLPVQVKDPTGQPLADALVRGASLPHAGPDAMAWRRSPRTAITGKDGLARLAWSRGESLVVQAFRPDLGESVQQVSPPASEPARELTLTLTPPRRQRVRVLDREGKPQPGVVAYGGEGRWRLGQTGDDGSLTIAAAPGRGIDVELFAADNRRGALRLTGDEQAPIAVALAPLPLLTGRLVSARDGAPIRHGLIWPIDHPALLTRSDAGGKLSVPLTGSRQIEVAASGFAGKRIPIPAQGGLPPAIVLEPVRSLTGRIEDPSGRPVAGAEVRASSKASPLRATAESFSDVDGAFRLSGLAVNRDYRVEARRAGYGPARREVRAASGATEPLVLVLRSGRAAFGTVRDQAAAKPVRSARVLLIPRDAAEEPLPAVLSDSTGIFHFDSVPPGSFTLSVRAAGFSPLTLPGLVVPAGTKPWDLGTAFLPAGSTIEGRVLQRDGSPVADAQVRVLPRDTGKGRPPAGEGAQASTDEDGRFTLADQVAGLPCRLEISAAGFLPVLSPELVPPTLEPVTVVVTPSSQIAGTVLAGGDPVAGAVVVAEVGAGSPLAGRRFYAASESDGSFLLRNVEPGDLILSASAEGYAESPRIPLALPPGERRDDVEIHLETGGTVTGTVSTREGVALAEAVIAAFAEAGGTDGPPPAPRTATSDRTGHFRLGGLRPGSWLFVASHSGFARKAVRQRIGGGEQPSLDFTLNPGAEIAGMVTDAATAPLPGARVLLSQDGRGTSGLPLASPVQEREVISQADGSFRFSGVEDGSYRLRATKAGFAPAEPAEPIAVTDAPINGIVLRLTRGSSISGRLLGLTPGDLAGIEVFASQPSGKLARGEVGPDGGYRLTDLEPGAWWLIAQVKGTGKRATGQVTLAEQPARLDLDFTRGAVLSGVVTVDGQPFAGAIVQLSSPSLGGAAVSTPSGGSFRISGLVEGLYSLQVEVPASRLRHVEEIDLSSDREVRIDLLTSTTTHSQPPRDP